MRSKKWTHGTVGSISHGTMRPQDLMPNFCDELRWLGHRQKKLTIIQYRVNTALNGQYGEDDAYFTDELSYWDLQSLFDMLDVHALPYMYFGSHPGDGSDYGFWVREDLEYCFDGLKVENIGDIPEGYTGEVLEINERGNMTLYHKSQRKLKEIWAVV